MVEGVETLEQMRARLDQCGIKSEHVDYVVALVRQIEERPETLPLHLVALVEALMKIECYQTAQQINNAYKVLYEETKCV